MLNLYYKIKEAYETSTQNCNRFEQIINGIDWDAKFFEDEEYYFIKGDMTLTTPSLNPFAMKWEATAIFNDGSVLTI